MSVRGRSWKVAAVSCRRDRGGSHCDGSGVRVYRYRFEGQDKDGAYHFTTEPEIIYERTYQDANGAQRTYTVTHSRSASVGAADATDAEQARVDLEEIALLRQKDARELIGVTETEVNGHLHTAFRYKYVLADGRIKTMGEGEPDESERPTPAQIENDQEQIALLREKGQRE